MKKETIEYLFKQRSILLDDIANTVELVDDDSLEEGTHNELDIELDMYRGQLSMINKILKLEGVTKK